MSINGKFRDLLFAAHSTGYGTSIEHNELIGLNRIKAIVNEFGINR